MMTHEFPAPEMDLAWARALDILRAQGHDPDAILRRAAENLAAWNAPATRTILLSWGDPADEVP